ncbi:DUF2207 family protein [Facklamia lactis]|nr:DUF2207 domain-containing protein [Facklamia lactis]
MLKMILPKKLILNHHLCWLYLIIVGFLLTVGTLSWKFNMTVKAQDIDYQLLEQKASAEVDASGKTKLILQYKYDANYLPEVSYQIPTNSQKISFYRVGVLEEGATQPTYLSETSSGAAGSFQMKQEKDNAEIVISYPLANEKTTFIIEYELDQLVTNYQDIAYYNSSWIPQAVENGEIIKVQLILPGDLSDQSEFKMWVHGQEDKYIDTIVKDGKSISNIEVAYSQYGSKKIDLHALFPKSFTPHNEQVVEVERKEAIILHEQALSEQEKTDIQSKQNDIRNRMLAWVFIPILITIILYWVYYTKRQENPLDEGMSDLLSVKIPPEDISPAIVKSLVYQQSPDSNSLAACLLELGRKGYLKLMPVRMAKRSHSQTRSGYTIMVSQVEDAPPISLLQTHERHAYHLFTVEHKMSQTVEEMVFQLKQNKTYRKQKIIGWKKYVDAVELRSVHENFVPGRLKRWLVLTGSLWLFIALMIMIMMVVDVFKWDAMQHLGWSLLLSSLNIIAIVILIILISRQSFITDHQLEQRKKWTRFYQILQESNKYDLPAMGDVTQWDQNISYALALNATSTIQQRYTYQFDMEALESLSHSYNADLYRVHGSIADILQSSIRELVGLLDPKTKWMENLKEN